MNSFKSVCSFAKSTPVPFYKLEKHVEPRLWSKVCVELIVCSLCLFKTAKNLDYPFHEGNCSICPPPLPGFVTWKGRWSGYTLRTA
jgi:hypothetical protein